MNTAQLFSFVRRRAPPDWSAQDIAEFYRVESILAQSGLRVTSARGLTDEGDPWFVFCRADDDEVIIHFARIDGRYIISSPAYCGNADGYNFRTLVRDMIERHPVLRPRPSGNNLYLHPAALLVLLVATAFLKSGHAAEAASSQGSTHSAGSDAAVDTKSRAVATAGAANAAIAIPLDATQETLLLSAINAAIVLSAPLHAVAAETAAVPPPGPDAIDQHRTSIASSVAMDRPHDTQVAGSDGLTPVPAPQFVGTLAADSSSSTHAAALSDAATIKMSSPEPLHYLSLSDAQSPSLVLSTVGVLPDAANGVQHVSLAALSDIPQADKVLLQALGVPDTVAYAPNAPATISTVIHAGVHTTALNVADGHAPAVEPVAAPQNGPGIVNQQNGPNGPGWNASQGSSGPAAVPDITAVMHIVQLFEAAEVQPTVLLSDHGVIFYDAAAINTQYSAVKSVTYDFGDGFSISLVGLPAELTHAGAHV